jgi:hypothetical protein
VARPAKTYQVAISVGLNPARISKSFEWNFVMHVKLPAVFFDGFPASPASFVTNTNLSSYSPPLPSVIHPTLKSRMIGAQVETLKTVLGAKMNSTTNELTLLLKKQTVAKLATNFDSAFMKVASAFERTKKMFSVPNLPKIDNDWIATTVTRAMLAFVETLLAAVFTLMFERRRN